MAKQRKLWSGLTAAELRHAYEISLETRAHIVACMTMKLRGEGVEFWIGGTGEEIHGAATAMALHRVMREDPPKPLDTAFFLHYRSDSLAAMTASLRGDKHFVRDYFRQALSRITDTHSGGRQMVMHLCRPEVGIWPMQSPVGMQLGKAAGYARGLQLKGEKGLAVGVVGDGTTGESDFFEACGAASVWRLPLLIVVTDNEVAISVTPEDGRTIKDFAKFAESMGLGYAECDGHDFLDTYTVTCEAARSILETGRPMILKARVPRLMGHSSSSGGRFDLEARDPVLEFGGWLVAQDILPANAIFRRESLDVRKSYYEKHDLGTLMRQKVEDTRAIVAAVRAEAPPSVEAGDLWRHTHPPHPVVVEPEPTSTRPTRIQMNEALNVAHDRILATGRAAAWGQDIGARGGVFKVTEGLAERYPGKVRDAPLNEPLIIATAVGAALHKDLILVPEIQFGDYALNCLHWFVHMGNLCWTTNGQTQINVTVRTPVDPVVGGAAYHSMSADGFFGNIPGLVITTPSTSFDAYGLFRTATDYRGPVLQLEPKRLYRLRLGPALPGEPDDAQEMQRLRRAGEPVPIEDFRVPFGKAARRRAGDDVTLVTWGWPTWLALKAAERLARDRGVQVDVLDLRTLKPYDEAALIESAGRTGRVLIAQSDRTYAGYGREIQGNLIEKLPGVVVRLIGQLNTPAIAQCRILEDVITLTEEDIYLGLDAIVDQEPAAWLDNELHWLRYAPSRRLS